MNKGLLGSAIALALLAAGTAASKPRTAGLAGTTWQLVELHAVGDAYNVDRPGDPSSYRMTLQADGTASLQLDCNRATSSWSSPDPASPVGAIRFSPLAMTRAACPPGSLDARVARELGAVRRYTRVGNRMTLEVEIGGSQQVWRRMDD